MILELNNPSDAITFVGEDPRVAGVAVLLLGHGWYGLTDAAGNQVVPMMIFGTHEAWLKEQGIEDFGGRRRAPVELRVPEPRGARAAQVLGLVDPTARAQIVLAGQGLGAAAELADAFHGAVPTGQSRRAAGMLLRVPKRCPECGLLVRVWPCVACSDERAKEAERKAKQLFQRGETLTNGGVSCE